MIANHTNGGGMKPEDKKRRRRLRRARAVHNYFMFFRAFTKLMSKVEAIFLQDLINREEMVGAAQSQRDKARSRKPRMTDEDEFFRCTAAFMSNEKYLVWTPKEQKRLFRVLAGMGYLEIKHKGVPPRRWVRINYDLIEERLDAIPAN